MCHSRGVRETEPEPVVMFSDYACPWCYLGRARLAKAVDGLGQPTVIRPFPLSPDTPAEGRDLVAYLEAKGLDVRAAVARLAPMLAAEGLEYPTEVAGRRQWNTRRAQELALWAEAQGDAAKLEALHDRLFRAYQVENLDVYDLVGAAGRAAVAAGELAEAREQSWRTATRAGITGVPTYVAAGYGIVGAQPVEVLREFVTELQAKR